MPQGEFLDGDNRGDPCAECEKRAVPFIFSRNQTSKCTLASARHTPAAVDQMIEVQLID